MSTNGISPVSRSAQSRTPTADATPPAPAQAAAQGPGLAAPDGLRRRALANSPDVPLQGRNTIRLSPPVDLEPTRPAPTTAPSGSAAVVTFAGAGVATAGLALTHAAATLGRADLATATAAFTAVAAAGAGAAAIQVWPDAGAELRRAGAQAWNSNIGLEIRNALAPSPTAMYRTLPTPAQVPDSPRVATTTDPVANTTTHPSPAQVLDTPRAVTPTPVRNNFPNPRTHRSNNLEEMLSIFMASDSHPVDSIPLEERNTVQAALDLHRAAGNDSNRSHIQDAQELVEGWADSGLIAIGQEAVILQNLMRIFNQRGNQRGDNFRQVQIYAQVQAQLIDMGNVITGYI